jgi:hypothetical protein
VCVCVRVHMCACVCVLACADTCMRVYGTAKLRSNLLIMDFRVPYLWDSQIAIAARYSDVARVDQWRVLHVTCSETVQLVRLLGLLGFVA